MTETTETATQEAPPPEPWPISNAIACLKEVRDRENDGSEHAETVRLAMDYAIEVVRSINKLREPQPPDPREEARKAVREFCRSLAGDFQNLGYALERIADGDIPDCDGRY
jgi:hypothetical protein